MAVKKTSAKQGKSATPTKASAAKDSATTTKKKSAPEAAAAKSAAPKGGATKAAKPKAAPIKLTSSQSDLLKKVHGAGEVGYSAEKKIEERSLAALQERKLIKKGAKDKATGKVPYSVSTAGKKHMESQGSGGAGNGGGNAAP